MENNEKRRHDLKNQLGIILGFSEILLLDAADDDPWRANFAEIHAAATVALDLLARVLPAQADTAQ